MVCPEDDESFLSIIKETFTQKVPFHRILGLNVESITYDEVKVVFHMKDDLLGHYARGMVHGGVISSVIDVTGGLAAFMGFQKRMPAETTEARFERFGRVSTVDLHVDFLRPGRGIWFGASASTLRTGNKVAVARIELNNDRGELIAVGSGSYVLI